MHQSSLLPPAVQPMYMYMPCWHSLHMDFTNYCIYTVHVINVYFLHSLYGFENCDNTGL